MAIAINDLYVVNICRANRWHPHGLEEWTALEWAGAMTGEAGEAANAAKKLKRMENSIVSLNDESEGRHYTEIEQAKRRPRRKLRTRSSTDCC
jgi:hypothetical protein